MWNMTNRAPLVLLAAATLAAWGLWRVYSGWGLVTLDFEKAPVSKVVSEIGRQGGIEIVTDLPATTLVTIKVTRVPPLEALDIVAVRTDSSWRLAYLGAPDKQAIDNALSAFRAGRAAEGWTGHGAAGFNMEAKSGQPLDLRLVEWQPGGSGELQALLAEAAESTGAYLSAPSDWSPPIEGAEGGQMDEAMPALFGRAGGVSREVFLLRGPAAGESDGDDGGWQGRREWVGTPAAEAPRQGSPGNRGAGPFGNPEAMAKRAEAQIRLLPAGEQEQARKDVTMMREFWQSVRDLPEEERRAKAREFFNRPEVQERMEDRRLARDAKRTPEQRIERSKRYWDRKAEAKYRGGGAP